MSDIEQRDFAKFWELWFKAGTPHLEGGVEACVTEDPPVRLWFSQEAIGRTTLSLSVEQARTMAARLQEVARELDERGDVSFRVFEVLADGLRDASDEAIRSRYQ